MKHTASTIAKLLKNTEDWGDLGDRVHVQNGNLVVVDTYFDGGDKALTSLTENWTTGFYHKYFQEDYGVQFTVLDTFNQLSAQGRYKKLTTDGVVGLVLKVNQK